MRKETIEVPDGYKLQQISECKWELVKSEKDIRDILKDEASYTPTCLSFKNGLDFEQIKQRIKRFMALSELQCVADYLNDGWEPNWDDTLYKWYIEYDNTRCENELRVNNSAHKFCGQVVFKTRDLAQRAIAICGERLIKEALGV